jgi:predicted PurR-regulated permease PerM
MPPMETWSRTTRYIVFLLMLVGFLWFMWLIQELIAPLVIAGLLAFVLNPIVAYVNKFSKLPRQWVVTLVYVIIIGTLTVLTITFAPIAVEQAQGLTAELQIVQDELLSSFDEQAQSFGFNLNLEGFSTDFEALLATSLSTDQIFRFLQATSQNLVWILVILVSTFYLLQDWHRLREWLIDLAPPMYGGDARRLYGQIKETWQAYLWGQIILMFIIGILSGVGAAAVGLSSTAVALGLLAGLLDIIPSAGPAVAMVIATAVAWFQGPPEYINLSNFWFAMLLLGIFTAIQTIENIWLRPRIMGHSLKMHPGVVFVAVMGALAIGGILVALVIIPTIGTLSILGYYFRARIFGMDPWSDPHMQAATEMVQYENGAEEKEDSSRANSHLPQAEPAPKQE